MRLAYVFVDYKTTSVHLSGPSSVAWQSIFSPAKSEAKLEVFAVRGGYYGETSDTYLEVCREFAKRAAELAQDGGDESVSMRISLSGVKEV